MDVKMIKKLATEAIQIQDACNGIAIANAYGKMLVDLRAALESEGQPTDTDALRNHPINRLWASKIHDLAGMGLSDMSRFSDAYDWCIQHTGD